MISARTAKLLIGCSGTVIAAGIALAFFIALSTTADTTSIPDTNEARQFLAAFERSVRECGQNRSLSRVDYACDAAMLCRSESASRTVEERCLEAFRHGNRMEQLVVGYVLTEWNRTVRPETKAELRELMLKSVPAEGTREDIKYLLEHFEKLEQDAEQQKSIQSVSEQQN